MILIKFSSENNVYYIFITLLLLQKKPTSSSFTIRCKSLFYNSNDLFLH